MIRIFWMCILLIPLSALCQSKSIRLSGSIEEIERGKWIMKISVVVKEGWWIYSDSNDVKNIDGLNVHFKDDLLYTADRMQSFNKTVNVFDGAIKDKVNVYYGELSYWQLFNANEDILDVIEVTVQCYIGDGKEIVPVSMIQNFCVQKSY